MNTKLDNLDRREVLTAAAALSLAAATSLSATAQEAPPATAAPSPPDLKLGMTKQPLFATAETTSGRVQGIRNASVLQFKGIPYGAPTGGANRFSKPRKPRAWTGVRECFGFGQVSPQVPMDNTFDYGMAVYWDTHIGAGAMGEDVLNLNVWTPAIRDGGKRAVMVCFHGGGWTTGSGNGPMYDGAQLVRHGDVVVVTINHRLGALGYAHLADLGAPEEFADAGICGVMDMVAGLEWVRDNIEEFGGDPNCVMIFGQSGGGMKVSTLMGAPAARGLFHRAAVQSGSLLRHRTREEATVDAEKLLLSLGIRPSQIGDLRKLPWQQILQAQAGSAADFRPVLDGAFLPRHPFDGAAPSETADVPMIISTTLHDASSLLENFDLTEEELRGIFKMQWGERADQILAAYREERPQDPAYLIQALAFTDAARGDSIRQAEAKSALRAAPAYLYVWDWAANAYDGRYGATHGQDVEPSMHIARGLFSGSGQAEGQLMTSRLAATWIAFAKTGNPANPLIPEWPAYNTDSRATMVFDNTMRVVPDYRGKFVRMIGEPA